MGDMKIRSSDMGFVGWLGLAFIVLKLLKVIAWPWVWVLAPLWIGVGLSLIVLLTVVLIATLSK